MWLVQSIFHVYFFINNHGVKGEISNVLSFFSKKPEFKYFKSCLPAKSENLTIKNQAQYA